MDKYKALSFLLLGIVIGLGYSTACGSGDGEGTTTPNIPGVGVAMAQSGGCSQWEVRHLSFADTDPYRTGAPVPEGWTPLGPAGDYNLTLWLTRCAQ